MHLPLNNLRASAVLANPGVVPDSFDSLTLARLPVSPCRNPDIVATPVRQVSVVFDPLDVSDPCGPWNRWLPDGELEDATPVRQFEFLAGRACAAHALRGLGRSNESILRRRQDGTPVWPAGITGSITHTVGFVSVAVGQTHAIAAVGIDSEEILSAERAARIESVFATPAEVATACSAGLDVESAVTLIFSAKESIFKCLHGQVHQIFDFHDVRITDVDGKRRAFHATLTRTLAAALRKGTLVSGNFDVDRRRVHTGLVLPRSNEV